MMSWASCRILTASLIHRVVIIVASSQSMTWFSVLTWSVIADWFCSDCDCFLSFRVSPSGELSVRKKTTVVAETSLILGKYCGCFVVLLVTVVFLFNRWVYSRAELLVCRTCSGCVSYNLSRVQSSLQPVAVDLSAMLLRRRMIAVDYRPQFLSSSCIRVVIGDSTRDVIGPSFRRDVARCRSLDTSGWRIAQH